MRVGIDAQLSSISAFSTDLKTLEQIKPIGQAAEFKFESKLEPLQVIWQSLPKAIPEDNRRFCLEIQLPSSWGRALCCCSPVLPAQAVFVLADGHKHSLGWIANQLQSLLATTGSLEEKHATNLVILLEEKHTINLVILTQVKS